MGFPTHHRKQGVWGIPPDPYQRGPCPSGLPVLDSAPLRLMRAGTSGDSGHPAKKETLPAEQKRQIAAAYLVHIAGGNEIAVKSTFS